MRTDRASVHKASWCLKYSIRHMASSLPPLHPWCLKHVLLLEGIFFFFWLQVRCVWREMGNTNCPVFSEVPMGSWDSPYRTDPRVDSRFQGKLLTSTTRDPDLTRALSWMRASVAKRRNGEGSQEVSWGSSLLGPVSNSGSQSQPGGRRNFQWETCKGA